MGDSQQMSVAIMKKLTVVTMREGSNELMRELQRMRCVDLGSARASNSELAPPDMTEEISRINSSLATVSRASELLSEFYNGKRSLFSQAREISLADFEKKRAKAALSAAEAAFRLSDELNAKNGELAALNESRTALLAWKEHPLPLRDCKTRHTVTFAGSFPPSTDISRINEALGELAAVVEKITESESGINTSVTIYKNDKDEVLRTLGGFGFTKCPIFSAYSPKRELAELSRSAEKLEEEIAELRAQAKKLSDMLPEIEILYDKLTTDLARAEATKALRCTASTVLLTGWVPEKCVSDVKKLLDGRGDAYEFSDPEKDDDVPVLLSNNAFASRFEPVIALYSLPAYGTFDPTFVMSFFYLAIFGLMFADVGYGLLLSAACIFMLRKMSMGRSMRMMVGMFAMCGIASAICGVIFGGYFGDLPTVIMTTFFGIENPPKLALWFDPVNNTIMFLIVSLACGAVHLIAGLCVKAYIMINKGDIFGAIFDVGSWLVLFAGIGVIFISQAIGGALIAVGVLSLILTQGRAEKNIIMRLLKGIMSLYGIVNYFSDLLSYSRILSLALSSAIIANVVNMLGTLPGPGFGSVIGLMIAVLIGHTLNIAINVLGTFVHTSRLQYIEFFGKFYEDGGTPFTPLTPHSKHVTFN